MQKLWAEDRRTVYCLVIMERFGKGIFQVEIGIPFLKFWI